MFDEIIEGEDGVGDWALDELNIAHDCFLRDAG
jgi:hypothetical protein